MKFITSFLLLLATNVAAFSPHEIRRIDSFRLSMSTANEGNGPTTVKSPPNDQAKYGKDLPLPTTYVRCGNCQASFALTPKDLGDKGKGCRVTCGLCSHSWYQSRDKLFQVKEGFELVEFPEMDVARVKANIEAGRRANFMGVSKLYIGNLDFKCKEEDILEKFKESAGEVGDVTIVRDPSGRSKGFGFVTMMTAEGGKKGLELDGEDLLGRSMQVREPNN